MKSRDALKRFRSFLAARGADVAKLSVREGIEAMLEFYRTERADDCSLDDDGDMLLFQWGTYDWGQGHEFELDITRQFVRGDGEDEDIWQLSLTFFSSPNAIASGDRWCHLPDDVDDFAKFVRSHAAYASAAQATPIRVELDFEPAG